MFATELVEKLQAIVSQKPSATVHIFERRYGYEIETVLYVPDENRIEIQITDQPD